MLHTHLSSGAGTIGQLVDDVPNGLRLISSHEIKKLRRKSSDQILMFAGTLMCDTFIVTLLLIIGIINDQV
jgi:hypothetical protein